MMDLLSKKECPKKPKETHISNLCRLGEFDHSFIREVELPVEVEMLPGGN